MSLRSKPSILAALDVHASELLPQLFLGYGQETVPTNILDVGAGGSHTLDAFAFYRSKVHFLDLFATSLSEQGSSKRQEAYAHRAFSEALEDCQGVMFDLCLFWGLFLALSEPALRGLNSALQPYLTSQSKGYVAHQLFPDREGKQWRYRIQDAQHLVRLPPIQVSAESEVSEYSNQEAIWSQTQFVERFNCLRITADQLHSDGRHEMLFSAS